MENQIIGILNSIQEDIKALKCDTETLKGDTETLKGDTVALKGEIEALKCDTEALKEDSKSTKEDIKALKEDSKSTKEDIKALREDLTAIKIDMSKMDKKIDKNTIILEELRTKLETSAEVQKAHMEQNEREFDDMSKIINSRSSLIETAVQRTSKDVGKIKENVNVLAEMTGKHEVEIKVLQRTPVY